MFRYYSLVHRLSLFGSYRVLLAKGTRMANATSHTHLSMVEWTNTGREWWLGCDQWCCRSVVPLLFPLERSFKFLWPYQLRNSLASGPRSDPVMLLWIWWSEDKTCGKTCRVWISQLYQFWFIFIAEWSDFTGTGRDGALFGISFLTRQVILPLFIARKQLTSNNI